LSVTEQTVKDYILEEFLPGEKPDELTASTPLISGGILDSLAMIRLVTFIQEQYGVEIKPHEVSVDHLNTITDIAALIESKR
jgi:acyl carrier protein